jgi:serine/threonine protein kinase
MPDPATDPNRNLLLQLVEAKGSLNGRFSNIQRVDPQGGGGWFSLVFFADDAATGSRVAIKVFHPTERADAYRLGCFNREAAVAAQLAGEPDIITCVAPLGEFLETVTTSVGPMTIPFGFFVLEAATGDVESELLSGPIEVERALLWFRTMCRAVQRIHAKGIPHRDIKPSNFLVTSTGAIKLSDFGTARDLAEPPLLARYTYPPGDGRYAAPEIVAALHDVDPTYAFGADIFALGVCLFELFSGASFFPNVFDTAYIADLTKLAVVPAADRRRIFEAIVPAIVGSHQLPSVKDFGATVPGAIRHRVDTLYRAMAALDYRHRLRDFSRIFGQIDTLLLIWRNQEKYDRWRAEKRRRAAIRAGRLTSV